MHFCGPRAVACARCGCVTRTSLSCVVGSRDLFWRRVQSPRYVCPQKCCCPGLLLDVACLSRSVSRSVRCVREFCNHSVLEITPIYYVGNILSPETSVYMAESCHRRDTAVLQNRLRWGSSSHSRPRLRSSRKEPCVSRGRGTSSTACPARASASAKSAELDGGTCMDKCSET